MVRAIVISVVVVAGVGVGVGVGVVVVIRSVLTEMLLSLLPNNCMGIEGDHQVPDQE